ncbi:hypothetical protein [Paracoccus lutimaris]|uniref:Uncharacterized protein n=1 Tax=Paracoccus lutimaris TaxID=1490030 RepID=A0A368YV41_9RHOB|nr:hypothetical protein [Paracoccus lutimaris]RCW84092.1 hypothetical protein DFP89_10836 [Paracoccus lutimaris]
MSQGPTPVKAPVWPGPRLIVPMAVDCLLVGAPDIQGSSWARTLMNYQALSLGLADAAPPPFTPVEDAAKPQVGAHLAWTLPYALRRGAAPDDAAAPDADEAGQPRFPLIPNRWLVLRAQYDAAGGPPQLKAWVILADHLEAASGQIPLTVSQYPLPAAPGSTGILGLAQDISDWDGTQSNDPPALTAIAPGNTSWVAAYDNLRNVLTMHDPLATAAARYGYSVIGWYSDPSQDLLHDIDTSSVQAWRAAVQSTFQWALGPTISDVRAAQTDWLAWAKARGVDNGAPEAGLPPQLDQAITRWEAWRMANGEAGPVPDLPSQMMLAGMLLNVDWQGADIAYGSGAPGGGKTPPQLAVGNTATEAIAAWIAETLVTQGKEARSTIPLIERAIEAFQAGLLNDLESDPGQTEADLHAREFAAQGSRNIWTVVRPEVGQGTDQNGGNATVPLTPDQTDKLSQLNILQREADILQEGLATQQSEYFALLWKKRNIPRSAAPEVKSKLTAALTAMAAAITATQAELDRRSAPKTGEIALAEAALLAALAGMYEIRRISGSSAYQPNDPVFLVAGSGGSAQFAAPGVYDEDDSLTCRITGQSITGLDLVPLGAGIASLDAGAVLDAAVLPVGDALPKEVPDLWIELLFSDPGAAPFLASRALALGGGGSTPAQIAALAAKIVGIQQAPWLAELSGSASAAALAQAAGLTGHAPSAPAVTFRNGQPWTPVFVDWRVSWAPDGDDFATMLEKWELGPEDFVWKGGQVQPPASPIIFEARTVFDPKVAQNIAARLATFKTDSDYDQLPKFTRDALENMVGLMQRADLFTLAASGVTQQLLTRLSGPNQDETDLDALLGSAPVGYLPVPGSATPVNGTLPVEPYFALRSGHMTLLDVWIVDSWGQILSGKPPNVAPSLPITDVIRAQSVQTPVFIANGQDQNRAYIQLAPRISDACRIDLQLLDAFDDTLPSNSADRTSPVCGYVIPNNLDIALAVFEQDGGSGGSVLKIQTESTATQPSSTGLRWQSPPGSNAALGAGPTLGNPHLQALVTGLLDQGLTEGGSALDAMFDHIDSVLWALAPLGMPGNGAGTLLGPPLAVVRARISAAIAGLPSYNQSWGMTGDSYVAQQGGKPVFAPKPVPVMAVTMPARLGDTGLSSNGVMGYFVNDDYTRFYAVYGAGGQTAAVSRALRGGPVPLGGLTRLLGNAGAATSGYVETGHLLELPLDGTPIHLTMLVDPRGRIPVTSGWQPGQSQGLPPGPVAAALAAMVVDFRAGPVLTDPHRIRMPLPSEVRGKWAWAARADITGWAPDEPVTASTPGASMGTVPLHLSEGWLSLSGALTTPGSDKENDA